MSQPPYGPPGPGTGPGYGPPGPPAGPPAAPQPASAGFAAPVGPRSNGPIWLALTAIVALGVTILIVLLVRDDSGGSAGTGGESAPGPRDVVVAFMKAAEDGDADEAKKYTCDKLDDEMSPTEGMPEDTSYEVGKEKVDGDSAEVPVTISAYGSDATMVMILEKKKSTWEICDYEYGE